MHITSALPTSSERRNLAARAALASRVRAEFVEMPCLRLTGAQAGRLFSLRADVCNRILTQLVDARDLSLGPDGRYRLRERAPVRFASPAPPVESCRY